MRGDENEWRCKMCDKRITDLQKARWIGPDPFCGDECRDDYIVQENAENGTQEAFAF